MVLVQAEDADWFGNLINWFIFNIIAYICYPFGLLFVLFGDPAWWYELMVGFELTPPAATDYTLSPDA